MEDCAVFRKLYVSGEKQKAELKYLLPNQAKSKISDNHLWASVMIRPVKSNFNRTDRLTCILVLLNMSMLMNILYYGVADSSTEDPLVSIGPVKITKSQVDFSDNKS